MACAMESLDIGESIAALTQFISKQSQFNAGAR